MSDPFLQRVTGSRIARRAADTMLLGYSRERTRRLDRRNVARAQEKTLFRLLRKAKDTRFGRDHGFSAIESIAEYQTRVPLRDYDAFWNQYWSATFPYLKGITWPTRYPYFALSSGTTTGATKYIPVSKEMIRSNKKGGLTMLALYRRSFPRNRLFMGQVFFMGGSTDLRRLPNGSRAGDLSGITACEVWSGLRPYTFPSLELSLLSDWDEKVSRLAEESIKQPITGVGGVPAWLLVLFGRIKDLTGKSTIADVWPMLRMVIHGGTSFEPYADIFRREIGSDLVSYVDTYMCSEGFIATTDPRYGHMRMVPDHGIFFEFVPVEELEQERPTRHCMAQVETGQQYAVILTTCAGLWSYVLGDTVVFERNDPPLIRFTGRTKFFLSAFGEHLICEEVERAVTESAEACGALVNEFHVGPVYPIDPSQPGWHRYFIEFAGEPPQDMAAFAEGIDRALCRINEDYEVHRKNDLSMLKPEVRVMPEGAFADWMRSRGKYGGQNKVPRMDNSGKITRQIEEWLGVLSGA